MYRTIAIAASAVGIMSVAAEPGLASGHGGSPGGPPTTNVSSGTSHGPSNFGGVAVTPQVKKLSPKAASACYRACMHGMDSSMENFCGVSCF
jgi:hypothetical protein